MAFLCRIPVRYGDCDVAGIVYYPRHLHFCHVAMEEVFGAVVGIPYARLVGEEHVGYPTVRLEAEYRRPVPYGVTLAMTVAVERLGRKSVDFLFEARRDEEDEVAFSVRTRSVAVDMRSFESRAIPAHHREGLGRILVARAGGESAS